MGFVMYCSVMVKYKLSIRRVGLVCFIFLVMGLRIVLFWWLNWINRLVVVFVMFFLLVGLVFGCVLYKLVWLERIRYFWCVGVKLLKDC